MSALVIKMQNCTKAPNRLVNMSALNALHALEGLVPCLPSQSQSGQAESAEAIGRGVRQTNLGYLPAYLDWQRIIADSRFGRLSRDNSRPIKPSTSQLQRGTKGQSRIIPCEVTLTISHDRTAPPDANFVAPIDVYLTARNS